MATTNPTSGSDIPPTEITTSALDPDHLSTPALQNPIPHISIIAGYRPGILGRTLEMHLDHYSKLNGWGADFEADMAVGLSSLIKRLDEPINEAWSAVMAVPAPSLIPGLPQQQQQQQQRVERTVGVIFINGERPDGEAEGVARLRAFIVDESARGLGVGRKLFAAAMEFVRSVGFRECQLYTLRSSVEAIGMYERGGFREVGEKLAEWYGKEHSAVQFSWLRERDEQGGDQVVQDSKAP
ncbi:hypothetical protein B0T17DRAFT_509841 [Bombardia bombarda]|uniref:N-acetyltransferase domain-containing protein n=1 Tax=Bombardia bombarda TaxID=252184 RepID=A0AA39WMT0_9PEZI|nr:hypothetical protein B0T17DRAFT_509841 [Bombardia bombarda]